MDTSILRRVRGEIQAALTYLNRNEIVRAYRATERASEEIDQAISDAEKEEP